MLKQNNNIKPIKQGALYTPHYHDSESAFYIRSDATYCRQYQNHRKQKCVGVDYNFIDYVAMMPGGCRSLAATAAREENEDA